MILDLEVPAEVLARLEKIAAASGVTAGQVAAEILTRATADFDRGAVVRDIITEDRAILDRLAAPSRDRRL